MGGHSLKGPVITTALIRYTGVFAIISYRGCEWGAGVAPPGGVGVAETLNTHQRLALILTWKEWLNVRVHGSRHSIHTY
jgi:hypothetical protein